MTPPASPARSIATPALLGVGLWLWAFWLLGAKEYDPLSYHVSQHLPLLWGFIGGEPGNIAVGIVAAAFLFAGLFDLGRKDETRSRTLATWLCAAGCVPLIDVGLATGMKLPGLYLAPIAFALLTGWTIGQIVRGAPAMERLQASEDRRHWLQMTWLAATVAGVWWFWQGWQAYDHFLLGFSDFGHFAVRVANTWEGHGFLKQGPDLPIFWDHFNPGLALLAPLWGIWPDARLFILLQAVCLAAPAPLVYGIARKLEFSRAVAFLWAAAYLALPAVGQLNLSYGYGWHPESIALPLIFGAIYALLQGQRLLALFLAIAAGSFAEAVIVAIGCLTFASLLDALFARYRGAMSDPWTGALPAWGWLLVWAFFTAAFVIIQRSVEGFRFQEGRFATLGDSSLEILLSPILRPRVFWFYLLRPRCWIFLLAVLSPLGLKRIARSGPLALALAPPLLVLFAWKEASGTSLAFQYTTTLLPLGLLAALTGARRAASGDRAIRLPLASAATSLAAALTLSTFIGTLPWSSPTLKIVAARSYPPTNEPGDLRPHRLDERAPGSPGHRALEELLAQVGKSDAKVLATGRVAAHLLQVNYIETVDNVTVRWDALAQRAGEGHTAVELFDWILLDTLEQAHQSPEKMERIIAAAKSAGYQPVFKEYGILLLKKPAK